MEGLKKRLQAVLLNSRGESLGWLQTYREWQQLPPDACRGRHRRLLTDLVAFAAAEVPYYRDLLPGTGILGADGVQLENWLKLPLLDKEILRRRFGELTASGSGRRIYANTSGGSTGQPVRFLQDREYAVRKQAIKHLFDEWSGHRFGGRQVKLWGSERDLLVGRETLRVRAGRWLRQELWLNAFRMTPAQMRDYVHRINDFRPVQILAYVESAYQLARFIRREGLRIHSPASVMVTAGTLFEPMRQTIESVFQAPVFNRYGSREVGDIACECEAHQGLHVALPTHWVEILRPDGTAADAGEVGEIVVTSLTNYAMPLIRYRIGDLGAWAEKPCSCGCGWPLLREICGRVSDSFIAPDGSLVHGEFFTHLLYFRSWVSRFQIHQTDYERIRILVVPTEGATDSEAKRDSDMAEIAHNIRRVMGAGCRVDYSFVPEIPATESGKYRYTLCSVKGH